MKCTAAGEVRSRHSAALLVALRLAVRHMRSGAKGNVLQCNLIS